MTITLVLIAGLALACAFVAGCIVGHRVAGSEMSDSARRWQDHYSNGDMERASAAYMGEHVTQSPPAPPRPPKRPSSHTPVGLGTWKRTSE